MIYFQYRGMPIPHGAPAGIMNAPVVIQDNDDTSRPDDEPSTAPPPAPLSHKSDHDDNIPILYSSDED